MLLSNCQPRRPSRSRSTIVERITCSSVPTYSLSDSPRVSFRTRYTHLEFLFALAILTSSSFRIPDSYFILCLRNYTVCIYIFCDLLNDYIALHRQLTFVCHLFRYLPSVISHLVSCVTKLLINVFYLSVNNICTVICVIY